jgi:hypothetical protein
MKRINGIFLILVLLMVAQGIKAESYTGTLERHGAKMEYSFSGEFKIQEKTDAQSGGRLPTIFGTTITGEVKVGSTLNLSCKKLSTSEKWKKVSINIQGYTTAGKGSKIAHYVGEGGSVTKAFTVPVNGPIDYGPAAELTELFITFSYQNKDNEVRAELNLKVVKEIGPMEYFKGTYEICAPYEEPDGFVEYTITGRNFRKEYDGSYTADYYPGEKVTCTCSPEPRRSLPYEAYISYNEEQVKKLNGTLEKTFTIHEPDPETGINDIIIGASFDGEVMFDPENPLFQFGDGVRIHVNLIKPNQDQPVTNNFKWNEVDEDRCVHCHGQGSEYMIQGFGEPAVTCMTNLKKEAPDQNIFEYYFSVPSLYDPKPQDKWYKLLSGEVYDVHYNDVISTRWGWKTTLSYGDEDEALTIDENSVVHLVKRNTDGSDRWNVYMGRIIGKNLKRHGEREPLFETPTMQARPTGTVFVLEADANTSRVYLLSGSMNVASKKSQKKATLKPGQASTISSDGKIKIQKFDVNAAARKYGITSDELQGVAATTTKRYGVERALVKYKVTRGNEEGVMAKLFDAYGHMERRELKMNTQKTVQVTQGTTSYTLNTEKKTAQGVKNAELNFMDFTTPIMKKLDLKKKGTGKVLEHDCDIYANSTTEYYVWQGIVLKKVERKGNTVTTTEATSIEQPATVDASLFKVPSGYTLKK